MLQMGATQSITNVLNTFKSWAVDVQNYQGIMLGGTNVANNQELFDAFRAAYGSGLAFADCDDLKLFIKSLCLDIQLNNNGTNTAIIEIYHLICRKGLPTNTAIDQQFTDAFGELNTQSGFTKSVTDIGNTPFQNPIFCSHWKILKKEQVQLGPGELSTLQIRIPRNKMLHGRTLESNPQALKGFTRGILFFMKGEPTNNAGTAQTAAGEIVFSFQHTVNYQIPPGSTRAQTANL